MLKITLKLITFRLYYLEDLIRIETKKERFKKTITDLLIIMRS